MDENDINYSLANELRQEIDKAILTDILEAMYDKLPSWSQLGGSRYSVRIGSEIEQWIKQSLDNEYTMIISGKIFVIYEFSEQLETLFLLRWS